MNLRRGSGTKMLDYLEFEQRWKTHLSDVRLCVDIAVLVLFAQLFFDASEAMGLWQLLFTEGGRIWLLIALLAFAFCLLARIVSGFLKDHVADPLCWRYRDKAFEDFRQKIRKQRS